jgi:SM-20-related protein
MQASIYAQNLDELITRISEQGFCVIDAFLDNTTVKQLAAEADDLKQAAAMKEARIGREQLALNKEIRGDSIYWLDESTASTAQQVYFKQMEHLRLSLNQHLYLGIFGLESHLATYPIGAFYKKHLDCFASQDPKKPQRKISCIVYLNHDWLDADGGQLRLYLKTTDKSNQKNFIDIAPLAGRAVVFLSDTFYHEVLPANRERKSLTSWFLTRPQGF